MAEAERRLGELIAENQRIGDSIIRERDRVSAITVEQANALALQEYDQRVKKKWERFETNDFQIIKIAGAETKRYISERYCEAVENIYIETLDRIAALLKVLDDAVAQAAANAPVAHLPAPQGAQGFPAMRLQAINLPTFSGNILEWESFRDQFRALVHDVPAYSRVQKLAILLNHLKGEAAEMLKNTTPTDADYEPAWNALVIRYGNQRILSFIHMKSLTELPPAESASVAEIKRLIDFVLQTIRSFATMSKPIEAWNEWFVFFLSSKLDTKTRLDWETSLMASAEIPLFQKLVDFLENRLQALQTLSAVTAIDGANQGNQDQRAMSNRPRSKIVAAAATKGGQTTKCLLCGQFHVLAKCNKYLSLDNAGRQDVVRSKKLCANCLNAGHFRARCPSSGRCRSCGEMHHTTLHKEENAPRTRNFSAVQERTVNASSRKTNEDERAEASVPQPDADLVNREQGNSLVCLTVAKSTVLLATAIIKAIAPSGKLFQARALLDPLITAIVRALGLATRRTSIAVIGFTSEQPVQVRQAADLQVGSVHSEFTLQISALVRAKLDFVMPASEPEAGSWPHIEGLQLADPGFATPSRIDILLGADYWNQIYLDRRVRGTQDAPDAYLTHFGYVLLGPAGLETAPARILTVQTVESPESRELRRFWELEEVEHAHIPSPDDEFCKRHFRETHSRDRNGRYIVRLPVRRAVGNLLDGTRARALALLRKTEEKLKSNRELEEKYRTFMQEYLKLGHMSRVSEEPHHPHAHYIPHHGVFKKHDSSKKIRVVFNAAAKAPSGQSLNSLLHTGPKLQSDLWIILMRWRMHKFVYATDCVKFYRQILVDPKDRHLQRVLFRLEEDGDIEEFELDTLTYGLAPAQFLALRCVNQLVIDEGEKFPRAVRIIEDNKYIDDYLFGADTREELERIRSELTELCQAGGLELAKWASNLKPEEASTPITIALQESEGIRTLGIAWNPFTDAFSLQIRLGEIQKEITPRTVLSDSSSIFDVLGRKAPVTIRDKIFMQDVWLSGASWDQRISDALQREWLILRKELTELQEDEDERWLRTQASRKLQVHGFADASSRAYAAVVYFRTEGDEAVSTSLAICKTKVVPIKTISIPKLELSAALLLAKLLEQLKRNLNLKHAEFFAWSDAQVALAWIKSHASRWKPFVANRVSQIQSITDISIWNYVHTDANPADLATRGMSPKQLKESQLWKRGPEWLVKDPSDWPANCPPESDDRANEELRAKARACVVTSSPEWELFSRYSSLKRLTRITAIMQIFIKKCQTPTEGKRRRQASQNLDHQLIVSSKQMRVSLIALVMSSQKASFPTEFAALSRKKRVPARSPMLNLRPFIGEEGCIRVGGRLQRANLTYDERHPYIIAKDTTFAKLLVRNAHETTLHGGTQLTLRHMESNFWILHGRSLVRRIVRNCVKCTRYRARPMQQIMAQLPAIRVKPQRPFLRSGVDFAGPISLKATTGRGHKSFKAYICLFICLATKAIHLEVAVDLSIQGFLAAFRRFVSRRGRCAELFSDNGTNFRGSSTELKKMLMESSRFYKKCASLLANDGTDWSFITPAAPHQGGIWKAGVKSAKHHLVRVIGDSVLTVEQMMTALAMIEACLNSRPLTRNSTDPNDLIALTPGHFLIGEPLNAIPEPPVSEDSTLSNKYLQVVKMRDDFWARWSKEYLHELQVINKWSTQEDPLQVGAMVLVKNELMPPTKWPLGRVVKTFPDKEGNVRNAEIRTATSHFLRPIQKLILLPI